MKQYLYSLKNRLSGIFERPVAEIYDNAEYSEYLAQSLALADMATLTRYKEFDVYCLGVLDNKSGEIIPCIDFVFSLEPLCSGYIAAIGEKDGKREETGV